MTLALSISPTAADHIRKQLTRSQANYLRLGVKESGCNGFMYFLDYLEDSEDCDQVIEVAGVNLCVAQNDQSMVAGTTIDLVTEGLNSALVFKNPKASSYCGCGESFAFGDATEADSNLDPNHLGNAV